MIPGAVYYPELLSDDESQRIKYFDEFADRCFNCDIRFF